MKKLFIILLCAAVLVGCAGNGTQTEPSQQETEETMATLPPVTYTASEQMLHRSILNPGNLSRLRQKIDRARAGEPTVIAYIGGSITEGPDVTYGERYTTLVTQEFATRYAPSDNVTGVNAGLSGTPSNLGVLRVQRDVLAHQPDIVFIEFAVNDSQDMQQKQCFESMVRRVLAQDNEPAVVLIFNRTQDGYSCQSVMGLTGMFYSLPMISVNDAVTEAMEAGSLQWREFSDDAVHPNGYGHRLTADFIAYLFTLAEVSEDPQWVMPQADQYGAPYVDAVLATPDEPQGLSVELGDFQEFRANRTGFPSQWRCSGGTEGLSFTVTGTAAFLVYQRNKTQNMGAVDVYINGEKVMTLDARDPDGWGDPMSKLLIRSKTVETWHIELRPAWEGEGKLFDVYGIAWCGAEQTQ